MSNVFTLATENHSVTFTVYKDEDIVEIDFYTLNTLVKSNEYSTYKARGLYESLIKRGFTKQD